MREGLNTLMSPRIPGKSAPDMLQENGCGITGSSEASCCKMGSTIKSRQLERQAGTEWPVSELDGRSGDKLHKIDLVIKANQRRAETIYDRGRIFSTASRRKNLSCSSFMQTQRVSSTVPPSTAVTKSVVQSNPSTWWAWQSLGISRTHH
jgi:hypothetical protein